MSTRLISLVAIVGLSGCIDLLDDSWFSPEKLDQYEWPNNTIPEDHLELVQLVGTAVGQESEAPEIFGVWAKQCLGETCVPSEFPERQGTTILYFHGNDSHLDRYWDRIQILWRLGYQIFAVDYRGFGRSSGEPPEEGLYADARTAMDHVEERVGEATVIYYGMSLGSTAAVQLATERMPAVLILEAPLASAQAFVDDATGLGVASDTLMNTEFDNLGKIPFIQAPKLIMHGTDDTFVRFEFGEMLYDAANQPKRFWEVEGAVHGNVPCPERDTSISPIDDPCLASDAYREQVGDFITDYPPED